MSTDNETYEEKMERLDRGMAGEDYHDFESLVQKFQHQSTSLFKSLNSQAEDIHHAATGMAGEAGEVLEISKKHWIYNKPLSRVHVIEELGDLAFYTTNLMAILGITVAEVLEYNYQKLRKRYPDGYTDEAAQERADKKEEILPKPIFAHTSTGKKLT